MASQVVGDRWLQIVCNQLRALLRAHSFTLSDSSSRSVSRTIVCHRADHKYTKCVVFQLGDSCAVEGISLSAPSSPAPQTRGSVSFSLSALAAEWADACLDTNPDAHCRCATVLHRLRSRLECGVLLPLLVPHRLPAGLWRHVLGFLPERQQKIVGCASRTMLQASTSSPAQDS